MSASLEDRLWDALEPAVVRELQRSRLDRTALARAAFAGRRLRTVTGMAVVLIALAAGAALIAVLGRPAPHPAQPHPNNVKTVDAGTALGDAATGYDAVWTYDIGSTRLLRVDPAARQVVARVPFPNPYVDAALATGAGAVWAVPVHDTGHTAAGTPDRALELVRLDPRTGRAVARIAIRSPGGAAIVPVGLEASDGAVWVWGQTAAVRVDPATNRVTGAIQVPGATIRGFAIAGGSAWIATDGGRLLRYDAAGGRRTGAARIRPLSHTTRLVALPQAVVVDGEHGVTRAVDPRSGRLRWQASLPGGIGSAVVTGSRIWILTTSATGPENELVALDADTGRAVARIGLPTSGGVALAAVGPDLWVTDQDGDLHIVHP